MNGKLDQTDLLLLHALQGNAKLTNLQLSEYVGLSPASTLERVRKLENQGFIQSYHAKLNKHKLDLQGHFWLQIRLHSLTTENITMLKEALDNLPQVISCYQIMGDTDFLAQIVTTNLAAYRIFLSQELSKISVIKYIKTYLCLDTIKEGGFFIDHRIA
jgi:Lrp/AsnC family leucine-responsive transcriptional regulator